MDYIQILKAVSHFIHFDETSSLSDFNEIANNLHDKIQLLIAKQGDQHMFNYADLITLQLYLYQKNEKHLDKSI